ncbi:MAG: PEP-CTERM system histidine kinase PrsK [Bryobacteraceae bacterium]|nr:PEP-CTERM system histidine kinase PrsK [Bryobacteraceae bacterium]
MSYLPFASAVLALLLAIAGLLSRRRSLASWSFAAGMALLGLDSFLAAQAQRASQFDDLVQGLTLSLIIKSLVPAAWLCFSLTYSRGGYREALAGWRIPLALAALLPVGLAIGFRHQLVEIATAGAEGEQLLLSLGWTGKALNIVLLVAHVWILMNLEQTFRAAVGTRRWQIKFVVLGLAVIFGSRIYALSQAILYSTYDLQWLGIESSGLLIGCGLLMAAYMRTGFAEIDVYPSRTVLSSSVTVLAAAGYLFSVGILARLANRVGGAENFELQTIVILLGTAGLALLLLSDRLRQRVHSFVDRHFARAQHDSVKIWTRLSRSLANVRDEAGLCASSVKMVSDTFEVLSVTIWVHDQQTDQLTAGATTAPQPAGTGGDGAVQRASKSVAEGLQVRTSPFDLEDVAEPWAAELRRLNATTFVSGGHRWCVPLRAGERVLGLFILADRVNGAAYTAEEINLLHCIADQVTSVLVNLRLAADVAHSREMEAFRTMSAFFVHDLKNAAASLNLLLKNLPVHFDDPAFRQDALRAVGNSARRIDDLIGGLSALRQQPRIKLADADLNQVVLEALDELGGMGEVDLERELEPLPAILADREQLRSVVTNLVLNARDAVEPRGWIRVRTKQDGRSVVLSVTDNGYGMSEAFVRDSLFRPFQTTKKRGLGIGMFQTRMIVEAHGGSIRVESETGKGSTFWVSLPIKEER